MANVNAPRGFKPMRNSDGRAYDGPLGQYILASAYATSIYQGDAVKLVSGYINKAAATDQIRGIVAGFSWTGLNGVPVFSPYWAASVATFASGDVSVLVYDDPNTQFEAVFTNSTSVPAKGDAGKYFKQFDAGGSTSTGLSGEGIDYSTGNTSSSGLVWRFIDFVKRPDNDTASAYSRGVFVPVLHDMRANASAA